MTPKSKKIISRLIRNKFDSLTMSYEEDARLELIIAAGEVDPILSLEMARDNKL